MWLICIAFKIFNDKPMTNRVFAFLVNIDVKDFNDYEMNMMNRLDFDAWVDAEMFNNYEEQLQEFLVQQSAILEESVEEYRRDKKILKTLKRQLKQQCSSAALVKQSLQNPAGNYWDSKLTNVMDSQGWKINDENTPSGVSKFRFESYNSYNFQTDYKDKRSKRSWSLPSPKKH